MPGGSQVLIYYFEKSQSHLFWFPTLTLSLLLTSKETITYFIKSLVLLSGIKKKNSNLSPTTLVFLKIIEESHTAKMF